MDTTTTQTESMSFHGRCWKFGDNVPTDQIVKSKHVFESMDVIAAHVLEDLNAEFPANVARGDSVVAGRHFGQSSGRAIATKAMQATGIGCIVAHSFARTFYRNCFEIGLPVMELPRIPELVDDGESIRVDIVTGKFENLTRGEVHFSEPPPDFLLKMINAGGLIRLAATQPELILGAKDSP